MGELHPHHVVKNPKSAVDTLGQPLRIGRSSPRSNLRAVDTLDHHSELTEINLGRGGQVDHPYVDGEKTSIMWRKPFQHFNISTQDRCGEIRYFSHRAENRLPHKTTIATCQKQICHIGQETRRQIKALAIPSPGDKVVKLVSAGAYPSGTDLNVACIIRGGATEEVHRR